MGVYLIFYYFFSFYIIFYGGVFNFINFSPI